MTSELEFFDINCAVGPPRKPTSATRHALSDLVNEMDHFGITGALVAHNDAIERGVHEGNRKVMEIINGDSRLMPSFVAPMHTGLDYPDAEKYVDEILTHGARAVRIQPSPYHGALCKPWALGPLWPALEKRRVPVIIDRSALGVYPDQPSNGFTAENIHEVCASFPDLPLILLRVNFSALRVLVPLMQTCRNLHAELSFFTAHRGVEVLAEHVGHERMVFGSGWPWSSAGPGVAAIRYSGLPHEKQQDIAAGNAQRLLAEIKGI